MLAQTQNSNLPSEPHLIGRYQVFYDALLSTFPKANLITDSFQTTVYSTDASFYRLQPKIIVLVDNEADVQNVIKLAQELSIPICFRAAGTSLSGQALTDSVLVKLSDKWQTFHISQDGQFIDMQCGVLGSAANQALRPLNKVLGPMPASIDAATVGGMAINNAAGMNSLDTYGQMREGRFIFANGECLDTKRIKSDDNYRAAFYNNNADLIQGIERLRQNVLNQPNLVELIEQKYKIKNTTGYSLRALIDFNDPIDVISHLMIGSEGTLGFISHITHKTVDILPFKATSLVIFDSLADIGWAISKLKALHNRTESSCELSSVIAPMTEPSNHKVIIGAAELIDFNALSAIKDFAGMPASLQNLDSNNAGLLVQVEGHSKESLRQSIKEVSAILSQLNLSQSFEFTTDSVQIQHYWQMRKGIFPAVGANRPAGTTALIEDVAFPIDSLSDALVDLQTLLEQFAYDDAVIYGHAFDGNLHFIFSQSFSTERDIQHYEAFMRAIVDLVIDKYQGSLKAEHGTGRNMAPFVEHEWGTDLYEVMKSIKRLFDPKGIFNPEVMLTDDQRLFVKNIKPLIAGNELIDKCIECGFCERQCPSKAITFTPRQRIVGKRLLMAEGNEINEQKNSSGQSYSIGSQNKNAQKSKVSDSKTLYQYNAIDTCAGCGLCEMSCPVGINTGDLIRQEKQQQRSDKTAKSRLAYAINNLVFKNFKQVTQLANWGVSFGHFVQSRFRLFAQPSSRQSSWFSRPALPYASRAFSNHEVQSSLTLSISEDTVNLDHPSLAQSGERQFPNGPVILFSACVSRVFGQYDQQQDQKSAFISVLNKAGFEVIIPEQESSLCCGLPFDSKGFPDTAEAMSEKLLVHLHSLASEESVEIPVLIDTSQCASFLQKSNAIEAYRSSENKTFKVFEPLEFLDKHVVQCLTLQPKQEPITFHLTCSARKSNQEQAAISILNRCAHNVTIPISVTCCGFAGDKGFSTPELNASALKGLKNEVNHCDQGYSTSRTCEMGLRHHSGINYQSIVFLLDEVSG